MPNHKNMFGTFYGNSSRSGNSTSSRGMGTRRSRNGGVSIGNGNLVRRRSGRNGMMNGGMLTPRALGDKERRLKKKCLCNPPAGYEDLGSQQISCYQWRQCSNCCQSRFGENWSGQDLIQGVRRRR